MIFQTTLTIPRNTAKTAIVSSDVIILPGVITRFEVDFPPGCCGLVYARVMFKEHQVWPSSPEQWFRQDAHVFSFPEDLDVSEGPYVFRLEGYNLDTKYMHTITIRIAMSQQRISFVEYINQLPLR